MILLDIEKELEYFMKSKFDMDLVDLDGDELFGDDMHAFIIKNHTEEEIIEGLENHFGSHFIFHTTQLSGILGILIIEV